MLYPFFVLAAHSFVNHVSKYSYHIVYSCHYTSSFQQQNTTPHVGHIHTSFRHTLAINDHCSLLFFLKYKEEYSILRVDILYRL